MKHGTLESSTIFHPFNPSTIHSFCCHNRIKTLIHIVITFSIPFWHTICTSYTHPFQGPYTIALLHSRSMSDAYGRVGSSANFYPLFTPSHSFTILFSEPITYLLYTALPLNPPPILPCLHWIVHNYLSWITSFILSFPNQILHSVVFSAQTWFCKINGMFFCLSHTLSYLCLHKLWFQLPPLIHPVKFILNLQQHSSFIVNSIVSFADQSVSNVCSMPLPLSRAPKSPTLDFKWPTIQILNSYKVRTLNI